MSWYWFARTLSIGFSSGKMERACMQQLNSFDRLDEITGISLGERVLRQSETTQPWSIIVDKEASASLSDPSLTGLLERVPVFTL